MNKEQLYFFNPYLMSSATDEQLKNTYTGIFNAITNDDDNPALISMDIDLFNSLFAIVGELSLRANRIFDDLKAEVDAEYNIIVYQARNEWKEENEGKAPSIDYFKAIANGHIKEKTLELNKLKEDLRRYKYIRDGIEQKMNTLKKKYDSAKFAMRLE